MKRATWARTLAAAVILNAAAARATVVAPVDLETLARGADAIVRGVAGATEAAWTSDGRRILSVTRVEVAAWTKGKEARQVAVRSPGGTVGGLTQLVRGAPRFEPGEEVVLFLEKVPGTDALFTVAGFAQGKFRVERGPGGLEQIVRHTPGVEVVGPGGRLMPAPAFGPVPLGEFMGRVRRSLSGAAP